MTTQEKASERQVIDEAAILTAQLLTMGEERQIPYVAKYLAVENRLVDANPGKHLSKEKVMLHAAREGIPGASVLYDCMTEALTAHGQKNA